MPPLFAFPACYRTFSMLAQIPATGEARSRMSPRTHIWSARFAVAGVIFGVLLAAVSAGPLARIGEPELEVRRHVLLSTSGNLPPEEGLTSAAYRINNNIWAVSSLPVPVYFNPSGAPTQHDPEGIIKAGLEIWSTVPGSAFAFTWAGTNDKNASTCASPFTADGFNTITFVTTLSPGTLGITCTVWGKSGGANAALVEFDMQINANINWASGQVIGQGQYDLFSTMLHELGHAAGLGHPCTQRTGDCTAAEEASVMYEALMSQQRKRSLRDDDINGIVAAYPQAQVTPANTPTPVGSPTPQPTGTAMQFSILAPGIARD